MKQRAWIAIVFMAAALPVAAQHGGEPQHETLVERVKEPPSEGEHGTLELWKWANFALLAGALGWMIAKNAGPFFAKRSREIRKHMLEAQEARAEAEKRAAEVDARLSNLQAEIQALRAEARGEQDTEAERVRQAAGAEMAKIQEHAEQEIASAGKAARMELKRYVAQLALAIAERKIQARMSPAAQQALVHSFVRHVGSRAEGAST